MGNQKKNKVHSNSMVYRKKQRSSPVSTFFREDGLALLLLIGVFVLLPFAIHFHLFENHLENVAWLSTDGYSTDLYLFWKSVCILVLASCMLFLLVFQWKRHTSLTKKENLPILASMGVYIIFALLSAFTSDYPAFAWGGSTGGFESTFVLIAYIVMAIFTFLYCRQEHIQQKLPLILSIGTILLCIVGIFQFVGHDLFQLEFVQRLLMPKEVYEVSGGIDFQFEQNRVYLTLFNPNYAGVYTTLLIPFFFSMLLSEKAWKKRVVYGVTLLLLITCLIGSGSKMGMLVTIFMAAVTLLFHRRQVFSHWKILLPAVLLLALFAGFLLKERIPVLVTEFSAGFLPKKQIYRLSSMETTPSGIEICYDNIEFTVTMNATNTSLAVAATRKDGIPVLTEQGLNEATFVLKSSELPDIPAQFYQHGSFICIGINLDGKEWFFTNTTFNGTYKYLNSSGNFDSFSMPETALFTDYPEWITQRGYIWARTIPLLKNHIFLGSGADTFLMEYPNNDYLGRYHTNTEGEYTTKPHNWYLQVAVQTGVISLIALLAVLFLYWKNGAVQYWKANQTVSHRYALGQAVFLAVTAYLLMGLTNDSSVTVAPLFWCLFGIGMACTSKTEKRKNN